MACQSAPAQAARLAWARRPRRLTPPPWPIPVVCRACVVRGCACVFRVRVGWAFCVLMFWCAELCRYVWCWLVCWAVCCGSWWCVCVFLLVLHRKRSHVYVQNARVTKDTGVLKVHTGASISSLLASLPSRVSFSLLRVSLFLFSLKNNDNDHSSSRLSLYTKL